MPVGDAGSHRPGADPVLRLSGVGLVRDGRRLLSEIDWEVRRGQRWVVLGPNGAGKTSLLQVAGAYEGASEGTVEILGAQVGRVDVRRLRRRLGIVSQALPRVVAPGTEALDLVLMGRDATLRRWRQDYSEHDRERAGMLLKRLGCEELGHATFETLSAGERQRVQIARSLMPDPELLLLDEPTAGLDVAGREFLVGALERLAADPATPGIVFVTHHVEEVPRGFTHGLLLRDGRARHAGPLGETLTADRLSDCFGMPLRLGIRDGRYWAVADGPDAVSGTGQAAGPDRPEATGA